VESRAASSPTWEISPVLQCGKSQLSGSLWKKKLSSFPRKVRESHVQARTVLGLPSPMPAPAIVLLLFLFLFPFGVQHQRCSWCFTGRIKTGGCIWCICCWCKSFEVDLYQLGFPEAQSPYAKRLLKKVLVICRNWGQFQDKRAAKMLRGSPECLGRVGSHPALWWRNLSVDLQCVKMFINSVPGDPPFWRKHYIPRSATAPRNPQNKRICGTRVTCAFDFHAKAAGLNPSQLNCPGKLLRVQRRN